MTSDDFIKTFVDSLSPETRRKVLDAVIELRKNGYRVKNDLSEEENRMIDDFCREELGKHIDDSE